MAAKPLPTNIRSTAGPLPPPVIPLPPKTAGTLKELIQGQRTLQAQIDAIVATARDLLGVPDEYVISNIDVGFVMPASSDQAPAD